MNLILLLYLDFPASKELLFILLAQILSSNAFIHLVCEKLNYYYWHQYI